MEGRSSLFNALITLTIIAILAVLACMFKLKSKRNTSPVASERREAPSMRGAAYTLPEVAPPNPAAHVDRTPLPAPTTPATNRTPRGPLEGEGYEILVGSTYLRESDASGSRFLVTHQGRTLALQLYHVESPADPTKAPIQGAHRADLRSSTSPAFQETAAEKAYLDARDFTRGLLTHAPFHIYTAWEPTENLSEYYAYIFVMHEKKGQRAWLSELLAATGHARLRECTANLPDNTPAEAFSQLLEKVIQSTAGRRGVYGM